MEWEFRKPLKKLGWAVGWCCFAFGLPTRSFPPFLLVSFENGESELGRADSRAGIRVPLQPQLGGVLRAETRET